MQPRLIATFVSAVLTGAPAFATAQADTAAARSVVDAPRPNYTASVMRLKEASARLRQAIQAMADQPEGERRNTAISEAHQALFDTQHAMAMIPPEARTGATAGPTLNYTQSMERLRQAAQKLRESVQAMAQEPAGDRRNAAIEQAREALLETQQAMVWLPASQRTAERWSASGSSSVPAWTQPGYRSAADGLPYNEVEATPEGIRYLSGGIGLEAQERLDTRAEDYNLKLVFTLDEGNYIADVDVVVKDAKGQALIDTAADGPFFMAQLPPGRYTVAATYGGKTVTRAVQVGAQDLRTAYLRWPSNPRTDFIPREG